MALIQVLIIYAAVHAILNKRLPLNLAMIFGSLLMIVMFRLPIATAGQTALRTLTGWDVWSVNLAMYVISVLVYELDLRHRFEDAQRAMNGLMRDPRLNTSLACLFIGLILGTLPSLWAEAGAQGRGRGAYLSCAASFLALSAVLLYAQYGAFYTMRPGFLGFLFCGLLWGLSLIVPGMTSSSILMAVGLFTPMAEGFARLDMAVILPWLLGMALIVLTLARVVNWCFQTHYPLFYHAVFGIVLASTVVIIPLHYDGARDALLCLLAAALGALAAYLSAKLQPKEDA